MHAESSRSLNHSSVVGAASDSFVGVPIGSPSSPTGSPPGLLPAPATAKTCMSAAAKRWKYLRRLFHYQQMDFDFAFWQMIYLLTSPKTVFRNAQYRKQTKLQFARDDPAFMVLVVVLLFVSTVGIALTLGIGVFAFILLLFYVVFVDCIGVGLVVATCLWALCNKYLLKPAYRNEADVEWGFAFDVHINALCPLMVILHFVMLIFYHVLISRDWFFATLFGNSLWLVAVAYYIYITFLGYSSLNILQRTKVFLYPMIPVILFYVGTLVANWNLSISLMDFYHYRVL